LAPHNEVVNTQGLRFRDRFTTHAAPHGVNLHAAPDLGLGCQGILNVVVLTGQLSIDREPEQTVLLIPVVESSE
jgi:hypothetical protein